MQMVPGTDQKSDTSEFVSTLRRYGLTVSPLSIKTMQINITRQCNQSCAHCHVDASPQRTERMGNQVLDRCLQILADNSEIEVLDITGGAPELHPLFYYAVERGRNLGRRVMVRHNLTVSFDIDNYLPKIHHNLPQYFAKNKVEIIASLPYFQEYFTDRQRGTGVFEKSISALKQLNAVGYGREGSGLVLSLVYNPAGAFLPASQETLEIDFKRELFTHHGIVFNGLFTIANMPIHRFKNRLESSGTYSDYMRKLKESFNPEAALNAMCRSQVSVGYDGKLYDCDFNQMLDLEIFSEEPVTVFNFDRASFMARDIAFGQHCYGCTAGAGSSCGGATT